MLPTPRVNPRPQPTKTTTHLEPRQKGQDDDQRGVEPRPRTRPAYDLTAAITRQPPILDSVLGEPWPINDGEFGMCVGQGAGLAHASKWGPRHEKVAYSARTGQGLFFVATDPRLGGPNAQCTSCISSGAALLCLTIFDTNSGLEAVHLILLNDSSKPGTILQPSSYSCP